MHETYRRGWVKTYQGIIIYNLFIYSSRVCDYTYTERKKICSKNKQSAIYSLREKNFVRPFA